MLLAGYYQKGSYNPCLSSGYNKLILLCLLLLILPAICLSKNANAVQTTLRHPRAQNLFMQGISASKLGDYDKALNYFQNALENGMQSPELHYNLGVTYYKLGQLEKSKREFVQIRLDSKLFALSRFNLGLIAQAQDDSAQALRYFQLVEKTASTKKLRDLSRVAINKVNSSPVTLQRESGWTWLKFETGYDNNALLTADTAAVDAASGKEDFLLDITSYGEYYLTGGTARGLRAVWYADYQHYADLNEYAFNDAELGTAYAFATGNWRHNISLFHSWLQFGGQEYQQTNRIQWSTRKFLQQELRLTLSADYERIDASDEYTFLSGYRKSVGFGLAQNRRDRWSLRYTHERNSRNNDFEDPNYYRSFSPVVNTIKIDKNFIISDMILMVGASISSSQYQGNDTRPDGTNAKRKDGFNVFTIGLSRDILNGWNLSGKIHYSENDSNFDEYGYQRALITVSMDKSFEF